MTRFEQGPAESPGFLLWRTTMAWQRAMTSALEPLGLTHVQFVLLACAWWLGKDGEPPNQVGLAAQAGTDVKMTSDVVARLAAKGLLTRAPDPSDGRAKVVRVTPEGAAVAQRAIDAVEEADAAFVAPLSGASGDDGLEAFVAALRALLPDVSERE
jgi:DNA-binding MarR family transcriptional regulator